MYDTHYDLVVIGAGTAGIVAALQAAREQHKVLLVERSAAPGGTIGNCNIAYSGLFHAWGKQIIRGIGWELVSECAAMSKLPLPDFSRQNDDLNRIFSFQIKFAAPFFSLLAEEKLEQAGVIRSYHTMLAGAQFNGDAWHVQLCTIAGLKAVSCSFLIDCSGDACAVALAGFPRVTPEVTQPATRSFIIDGYDYARLDIGELQRRASAAIQQGDLRYDDLGWSSTWPDLRVLLTGGANANHIPCAAAATAEGRTKVESEGLLAVLRVWKFLSAQPELRNLSLRSVAAETGVRESCTIQAEHVITGDEYLAAAPFADAVCYGFYPLDLHGTSHFNLPMTERLPAANTVPQIPLRALVPAQSHNLLVAGRCLGSDRQANSALRVQAIAMATGQAAAAAAICALRARVPIAKLNLAGVHAILRQHDAITP